MPSARVVDRPALRVLPGGSSNSRPTLKCGQAGVDTVRLRYRDGRARLFDAIRRQTHQQGARGELYVQRDGCRWGAFPDGLGYVEGRVAALLDGPEAHYLATPRQVVEASEIFANTVGANELADVVLGRLDLASELRFDDGREGLALMRAMAALDVPWLKTGTEGSKRDGLETVQFRTINGRTIQLRLYDKGRESGQENDGEHLRAERQRRFRRGREIVAEQLPTLNLAEMYVGRELRQFTASGYEATVCNSPDAVQLLNALADSGRVTQGTADVLAGFVARGRRRHVYTRQTWDRRWAALRQLGIFIDDQASELVSLPVAAYVGQLVENWAMVA